jgi:uncharacterized membrane protein required for colicin V production
MEKKKLPRYHRAFMFSLAVLSIVLAALLMTEFLLVPRKLVEKELLENTRMVYLFFITAYGGGKVAETRIYDLPKERRQLPLEFITIAWGVLFSLMTIWTIARPHTVPIGIHGEITFVTAWVAAVFIAVRTGKDVPDHWVR